MPNRTAASARRYLMPEQTEVTRLMMAWAELYIRLRSVCPTWADVSKSFLEYCPGGPELDHLAKCKLYLANNNRCARRYRRWHFHVENAPWSGSGDPLDANETAKSHCVGHMMSFQSIMGPVDRAYFGGAPGVVRLTAANLSAIGPYASTTAADADLPGLLHVLRNYWAENGLGDGTYPADAVCFVLFCFVLT